MANVERNAVYATGRRKEAVARVWLQPGSGKVTINHRDIDNYFGRATSKMVLRQPLALTSQTATRYRCALLRDVYPLMMKYVGTDREELLREAETVLVKSGVVKDGDLIVLTLGEPIGKAGGTNTMKIVRVGEHR